MPSILHEGLIEMFRQRPSLAAELLGGPLAIEVPDHDGARLDPGDLGQPVPTEHRADVVVTLTVGAGDAVLAVVVEVQLSRDAGKLWSWPVYVTTLRTRLSCPVVLLVVCAERSVARWCARPIRLGPGSVVSPVVLGPDRVPVVVDAEHARREPELTVLSALAHGAGADHRSVLAALSSAFTAFDNEHFTLYSSVVLRALPGAARHYLEAEMASAGVYRDYGVDFVNHYVGQGRVEGEVTGEAKAILKVLAARGIDVPGHVRDRVMDCRDLDRLDLWLRRAVTAAAAAELFD